MELTYYFGPKEKQYDFEVDDNKVFDLAVDYYCNTYGVNCEETRSLVRTLIAEEILQYEYDDYFIEYLEEYFKDEAAEQWEEYEEYHRDPYGYYGVSRSDFF